MNAAAGDSPRAAGEVSDPPATKANRPRRGRGNSAHPARISDILQDCGVKGFALALPKVYVKVYGRDERGTVAFYKDGYTDLRGRFDYATVSNDRLAGVREFSILVLSSEHGAVVKSAHPPQR